MGELFCIFRAGCPCAGEAETFPSPLTKLPFRAQSEVGKEISGIQIRHIDELESFCAEHHPKVAVLCVPRDGAEQVSGRLVDLGIEGFWNFSHYDLSVPYPDVVVENVHLGDSLMSLGYRLRNQD